jgi:hypothetical protein
MFGGKGRVTQLISIVPCQSPKPLQNPIPNIHANEKARNSTTPSACVFRCRRNGKRLRLESKREEPKVDFTSQLGDCIPPILHASWTKRNKANRKKKPQA